MSVNVKFLRALIFFGFFKDRYQDGCYLIIDTNGCKLITPKDTSISS